jgi:hypothetical protein
MFDTCKSKAVETLSTHNMPIMRAGCEEKGIMAHYDR